MASASPTGMQRLEAALNRAADGLPACASRLRRLFLTCPDDPDVGQCARTAAWCKTEAERMRTRIHYALAENRANPALLLQGPLVPIPERFGPREMADLGRMQALAFSAAPGTSGPSPLLTDIARSLRDHADDPDYLAAFFSRVPPGSIGKLPYTLYKHHEGTPLTVQDKALISDMGTALAALSRRQRQPVDNALGPIGSDMPGQGLLVRLSAPNVRWSSSILLDLARASLRWRQTHPSYEIHQSSGVLSGEPHSEVVNQPDHPWWQDWGLTNLVGQPRAKALREYDPALNVLGRIAAQHDLAAARELAATRLEKAFTIADADKARPLTWLTRAMGGTYMALLISPDWPEGGTTAGSVIRLATTPERGHEGQAARNAADAMKAVAWWNQSGREKLSAYLRSGNPPDWWPFGDILPDQSKAPGWVPHSKHYAAELGPGLRAGLLDIARMHLATLADANKTSRGTDLPDTDPVTGRTYINLSGDTIQAFLRTLAADDKTYAQLAFAAQQYRQHLLAWGLRNGVLGDAETRSGYLEGNLISGYIAERTNNEKLTQQQYQDAAKHLSILRDVIVAYLATTKFDEIPGAVDGTNALTNFGLTRVDDADFDKRVEAIKAKVSTYSDQLYIDLARAYYLAHDKHTGNGEIDALLRRSSLDEASASRVIRWALNLRLGRTGGQFVTGRELVEAIQNPADHNAPQN
ncbi:hypothetical protein [Actinomadura rupiterrae]|uniref:hypothetical protein n=1 Tax=Actinomadura rupiterrae TaxID=559627 RepID=UPI0020A2A62C|nr:hypothetical protein [Actinomadura rupiterrae]MCP2337706.1 hypothetical protein [Actinomadura rupiterrae]